MVSVLVLFQAMLSLFLGTSSLIMSRQMHFVNSKDLGFNHDQVIVLPTFTSGDEAVRVITKFKNSASKETSIKSVAACSNAFFGGLSSMGFTSKDGERKSSKAYSVDEDFIETFGLEIEEGRNFSVEQLSDSDAVIVNRKLANEISDSPLGDSFTWGSGQSSQVIGILKDFNFRSLEFPIDPLFLTMNKQMIRPSVLLIKAKEQNVEYALKRIEAIFMETDPDKPFEFKFLSNVVQAQYHSYRMWTTIIQFSSLFSAFIACIGLFALTGIDASNKYKEIGIRKVFGANTNQILLKISRRYIVLILVASMVGAAVSYSIMSNWILNFAFRINIDWKIYAQGIFIGLIIFIISIGYHSLNAARTNPAETLKHEG